MSCIAGYSGLYRQPYANTLMYGDTIYVFMDSKHQELNLIILTPGFYKDAFRIASSISFQRINIFVPSVDVLFISDLFRLVVDLMKIKKDVKFHYPEKVTTVPTNVLFEMAQVTSNFYSSPMIEDLTIEFRLADKRHDNHRYYDIYVCDGEIYDVFTLYMSSEKLTHLMTSSDNYDHIHLPYNSSFYGGHSCRECAKLNHRWQNRLVPNNFSCREEFIQAAEEKYGVAKRIVI